MNIKAFGIQLFLSVLLLTGSTGWVAASPDSLIHKGNAMYNEGLYNDAIVQYNKVRDRGYESPELYYNIGNAGSS
ncbi:MAG: hypothetical protein K9G67_09665 [Bacteroidales bacterium]|nr:hypothetical protein [Bacteroidales bacterium]MCF8344054.1 hypothetical protein [Bacteroidales bacterium]MCF8351144.1 hypothetical protein [Bacteroidales bacterium]MCF8376609.1 hypothetical protein [Bacteroidales bacterium]MCF8400669.1 hypothetical protein [Bacteroidales bacterium]